jgi:hypothetical protein
MGTRANGKTVSAVGWIATIFMIIVGVATIGAMIIG